MDKDWDTPTWIDAKTLPDEAWSEAWRAVDEPLRARLKTALASLCQVYAPAPVPTEHSEIRQVGGLRLIVTRTPLERALVLFSHEVSAAQVMAAAAPARLMGLDRVLVVRVDGEGSFPDEILCALELAGVEEALDLDAGQARELAGWAVGFEDEGLVLGLGCGHGIDHALGGAPDHRVWRGRVPKAVFVYEESLDIASYRLDLETIVRTVSPAEVLLFGPDPPEKMPAGIVHLDDDLTNMLHRHPQAAYVNAPVLLDNLSLYLGPGQEGTWIWSDLAPERFLNRRVGIDIT